MNSNSLVFIDVLRQNVATGLNFCESIIDKFKIFLYNRIMKKIFFILIIPILAFAFQVLTMPLTASGAGINEVKKSLKSDGISSQNSQSINQSINLFKG